MPNIRPISDLRNNSNEISEFCRTTNEPVFITRNGVGDMVVMSIEMYKSLQAQIELYAKFVKVEGELAGGAGNDEMREYVNKLRSEVKQCDRII